MKEVLILALLVVPATSAEHIYGMTAQGANYLPGEGWDPYLEQIYMGLNMGPVVVGASDGSRVGDEMFYWCHFYIPLGAFHYDGLWHMPEHVARIVDQSRRIKDMGRGPIIWRFGTVFPQFVPSGSGLVCPGIDDSIFSWDEAFPEDKSPPPPHHEDSVEILIYNGDPHNLSRYTDKLPNNTLDTVMKWAMNGVLGVGVYGGSSLYPEGHQPEGLPSLDELLYADMSWAFEYLKQIEGHEVIDYIYIGEGGTEPLMGPWNFWRAFVLNPPLPDENPEDSIIPPDSIVLLGRGTGYDYKALGYGDLENNDCPFAIGPLHWAMETRHGPQGKYLMWWARVTLLHEDIPQDYTTTIKVSIWAVDRIRQYEDACAVGNALGPEDPPSLEMTFNLRVDPDYINRVKEIASPKWWGQHYYAPILRAAEDHLSGTDVKMLVFIGEMNNGVRGRQPNPLRFREWMGPEYYGWAGNLRTPDTVPPEFKALLNDADSLLAGIALAGVDPDVAVDGYGIHLYVHSYSWDTVPEWMPYATLPDILDTLILSKGTGDHSPYYGQKDIFITELGAAIDTGGYVNLDCQGALCCIYNQPPVQARVMVQSYDSYRHYREKYENTHRFKLKGLLWFTYGTWDINFSVAQKYPYETAGPEEPYWPLPAYYTHNLYAETYGNPSNKPLACRDSLGTWSRGKRFLITEDGREALLMRKRWLKNNGNWHVFSENSAPLSLPLDIPRLFMYKIDVHAQLKEGGF
ncbi:MAG: hypothetical protein ABIN54_10755 [candidate division WOR-3 bacterium]